MLDEAIAVLLERDGAVRLFDPGAGPGRYVVDTMVRHAGRPITARLGDLAAADRAAGRQLVQDRRLQDCVSGSTKTTPSIPTQMRAALEGFAPNLVVVSGLYELFPDNALLQRSLATIAEVAAPDTQLLYTNHPWHPQRELIARVVPKQDGLPRVLRCRSQQEMDALVREAGFVRRDLRIDDWGIFSVARAERASVPGFGLPISSSSLIRVFGVALGVARERARVQPERKSRFTVAGSRIPVSGSRTCGAGKLGMPSCLTCPIAVVG